MQKFRLLVQGDVQQVGFREYIKKLSQKFKAKGCVRNLDDGSVEIYCLIDENLVEAYKEGITKGPGKVEEIFVYSEAKPEFGTPPCDFSKFKVIRDEDEIAETLSVMTATGLKMLARQDEMLALQKEMLHKQDLTLEKLDLIIEKIDSGNKMLAEKIDSGNKMLAEKIDNGNKMMAEKIDSGNKMLAEKIDSMHADMNERFDRIEAKYGVLSETLMGFMQEFRNFSEAVLGFMQEFRSFNAKLDEHNRKLDLILEKLVLLEERRG